MKSTFVLAALLVTGCGVGTFTNTLPIANMQTPFEQPKEIVVKFKVGYNASGVARSFHSNYGAKHTRSLDQIGYHLFQLDPGIDPVKTLEAIRQDPRVELAEFNDTITLPPLPDENP